MKQLLFVVSFLLCVGPASAQYVTGGATSCTAGAASVSLTNNTSDTMLVPIFVVTGTTVQSIIDSQTNAAQLLFQQAWSTNGQYTELLYAFKNVKGGSDTVNLTVSNSGYCELRVYDYKADPNNPIDVMAQPNTGTMTSAAQTNLLQTTNPNDVLFAFFHSDGDVTNSVGSGWTARQLPQENAPLAEDKSATAIGSYTAPMTFSAAANWMSFFVAIQPVATHPGNQVATQPLNVVVTSVAGTYQVQLSWVPAPALADWPGPSGYNVYRAIPSGSYSVIGTVAYDASQQQVQYTDTTVVAGASYTYYVTDFLPACSTTAPVPICGESGPSNVVSVTIPVSLQAAKKKSWIKRILSKLLRR